MSGNSTNNMRMSLFMRLDYHSNPSRTENMRAPRGAPVTYHFLIVCKVMMRSLSSN